MTITVTETPHQGRPRTWTCADREAFCAVLMRAHPHADWSPDWSFDQFRDWLASDLRALDIDDRVDAFQVGDRVEAGSGDDHDTGRILGIDGDEALIGWDSCIATIESLAHLRRIRA